MIRPNALLASACVCLMSFQASARSVCTAWPELQATTVSDGYCAALTDPDMMEKKYARIAPFHSSRETGWIFAADQLVEDYAPKAVAMDLLAAIVDEFEARDITLALMVAPPRAVVAGQAVVDATMAPDFDAEAARVSFNTLIDEVRKAGAIAPNLLATALADESVSERFYFHRDTHWTPYGAAVSGYALADALFAARQEAMAAVPSTFAGVVLDPSGVAERGSLADVVRDVCGIDPAPEAVPTYDFGQRPGMGLLDTSAESDRLALVGTSFSNRYGRDEYRVADALAAATGMEVDNYAVSGGGPISSIESYVLTGEIDSGRHAVVVWEVPYTMTFKSISALRQLLGALEAQRAGPAVMTQLLSEAGKSGICLVPAGRENVVLAIDTGNARPQSVRGVIRFDNGSESKFTIARSDRVPAERRSQEMFLSLSAFPGRTPVEIALSHDPARAAGPQVTIRRMN